MGEQAGPLGTALPDGSAVRRQRRTSTRAGSAVRRGVPGSGCGRVDVPAGAERPSGGSAQTTEDEARHQAVLSDEHKAYQERIVHVSVADGHRADSEVRTPVGPRSWVQTDTLVQGAGGIRIGWEIQLSSAGREGPRSVKAQAGRG